MPLPIDLDTRYWIRFAASPAKSEVVRVRGNACYYSLNAAPPELKAPGEVTTTATTIELAENGEVAVEGPTWFLQKATSSERPDPTTGVLKETPKPAILETLPAVLEGIGTTEILNEAVTEPKIAKEAVGITKVKTATVPAVAAEKAVKVGTGGVDRAIVANLTGDETASQKYKVVHNLETSAVTTEFFSDNAGKPGTPVTSAAALPVITVTNLKEIELAFGGTEPKKGVTVWCKVEG